MCSLQNDYENKPLHQFNISQDTQRFPIKLNFSRERISDKTYFFLVGSGSSVLFGLLHCRFAIRPWRFETESGFDSFWFSASLNASNSIFILYASWFTFTKIRYNYRWTGQISLELVHTRPHNPQTVHFRPNSFFFICQSMRLVLIRRVVQMRIFYLKSRKSRGHPFWPNS